MQTIGFLQTPQTSSNDFNTLVPPLFTHACAVGQTGCGKTSSFIYPNLQHRIEQNHGILLYDFKGKEHLSLKYFAHQQNRLEDVVEIGKPWGAKINLIRLMDRASLDTFIKSATGYSASNTYWPSSASKLFLAVYEVVALLEKVYESSKVFQATTLLKEHLNFSMTISLDEFDYPTHLSFTSVMEICQSEEKLAGFSTHLEELEKEMQRFVIKLLEKSSGTKVEKMSTFQEIMKHVTRLNSAIHAGISALSSYKKVDGENPKVSIMMTLIPLVGIANRAEFNTDSFLILEALQAKKLISVNAKDMSSELIEGLTYALFDHFAKRSMLQNITPISVFIDEAQRVISANQDHNLEVLRECKVEMFLAYQNEELMENKLGANQFKAMKQNLKSTYYFTNEANQNELDVTGLEAFECFSSVNNYAKADATTPVFLSMSECYKVENLYQKSLNIFKQYGLTHLQNRAVLLYDAKYYAQDKVLTYYLKSEKMKVADIFTLESREDVMKFYKQCTSQIIEKEYLELDLKTHQELTPF